MLIFGLTNISKAFNSPESVFFSFVLVLLLSYSVYSALTGIRTINSLRQRIKETPIEGYQQVDGNLSRELGFELKIDASTIDIIRNHLVTLSIDRSDISNENSHLLLTELRLQNRAFFYKVFDTHVYYQLYLVKSDEPIEIANVKRNLGENFDSFPTLRNELRKVADYLAAELDIKIKDCTQHLLSK